MTKPKTAGQQLDVHNRWLRLNAVQGALQITLGIYGLDGKTPISTGLVSKAEADPIIEFSHGGYTYRLKITESIK